MDGKIASNVEGTISGNPSSQVSHSAQFSAVNNKIFNLDDIPATGSSKIQIFADGTAEVWTSAPMNSDSATGSFNVGYTLRPVAEDSTDLFKEAFDYGYAPTYNDGLGMDRDDAQKFAEDISAMGLDAGGTYLDAYKPAFTYGFKPTYQDGAGLDSEKSKTFADAIARSPDPSSALKTFKRNFTYAFQPTYQEGLGLGHDAAVAFAAKQAGIKNPLP